MPRALLSVLATLALGTPASAATTTLRQDGIGPLTLGMTRTAALKTGWLSDRVAGCPLVLPRPVTYSLRGPKAPSGLRGTAEFSSGVLTNVSVTRGAQTALGIRPHHNSALGMVRTYRRAGYTATAEFAPDFGVTFVRIMRGGANRFGAVQTGATLDQISIPSTATCE